VVGDTTSEIMALCDKVRQTGFDLRSYLGHGHVERVYENGLAHRLRKLGVQVKQQVPITVHDEDGTILGEFACDLLVEQALVVELKACKAIADEHVAQLLGYLRATGIEHGLLVNFGAVKFEIKKFILSRR
jgi:GxxExxY protein